MSKEERVAEKLARRLGSEDPDLVETEDELGFRDSTVVRDDYRLARTLKTKLVERYDGVPIEDATGFEPVDTEYGEVLHRAETVDLALDTPRDARGRVLSDLKLVKGIGPSREQKLKRKGYGDLRDLANHRSWGEKASRLLDRIEDCDEETYRAVNRWRSGSDPLCLTASGLYDATDVALLDIETLGLTNQPIILLGLALPRDDHTELHQYLLRDVSQEIAALTRFLDELEDRKALLSFNGKSFDVPYVERRAAFYGLPGDLGHPHFDLYHFSRRAWGDDLPNCRLTTLETHVLDRGRAVDIPSSMVPAFYDTYRDEENPGPLIPILEHNRRDIETLAHLYHELHGELLDG